ncbi:MAG: hypothetical protein Kow0029_15040 [Candidatus Rifleibacteriota bacterium]
MTENEVKTKEQPTPQPEAEPNQSQTNSQAFYFENILIKRFIATFIDMVLIGVASTILIIPAMLILPKSPINLGALFCFFVFSAATAAILLKDTPFKFAELDGQTPGKKAMNIRVTDLNKKPITMQQSIQRNLIPASGYVIAAISSLINVIPLGPISGILGLFVVLPLLFLCFMANAYELYKIFSDPQHRRWGDQIAGTIVAWE